MKEGALVENGVAIHPLSHALFGGIRWLRGPLVLHLYTTHRERRKGTRRNVRERETGGGERGQAK